MRPRAGPQSKTPKERDAKVETGTKIQHKKNRDIIVERNSLERKFNGKCFCLCLFEIGPHCVAQTDLELMMLVLQLSE